ncbi:response regulator transcription factor [Novosphingobium sp. PhB165]|uniref:helix-turn-helix transcriptional regulator n=1 Tax=Novosphingobium sp. PhB165 TaxID=2485105 RepID=UPI001404A8AE|nr:response regulator transcription factor [Novosphingobium sp. PhB165]
MIRRLIIADDHPICVSALTSAVHAVDNSMLVSTAETLAGIRDLLAAESFDALLLDLALKDCQGLANLAAVQAIAPRMPVLVVSGNAAADLPAKAATLGARGFLNKTAPLAEMKSAIAVILEGGTWFPLREEQGEGLASKLSPAQLRVMSELAQGKSNKLIAYSLGLTEPTIKSHLSAIYRALGVHNRSQALLALRQGADEAA